MTRHLLLPLDLGLLLATSLFHTASGARVILGPEIGRGGEGSVYEVVGAPDLVAKVYTDGRADDRREKIEAMAAAGLHRQASHISFPIDVLLGDKGTFVGFTMRRIKGALPIHQLWGSRDRQDKFPDATVAFMVRVAGNAARAVGELHQAGCVIGDINESGFLVTDQATVVLIDSDSIQVTVGNRVFPCVVGTPQYLPPEHQSVNQRQLGPRAANHDNFGLAVLIFRLLMAGTHPFMGRWNGPGDPPALPKWIEEFRYAYGTDAARMKVGPQPAAPPIDWLSDEIRAAFNQAFGKSGVQARPTAADWIGVLDQFEKTLMACGRSRYHHHRPGVRSCPWCETEKTRGKALFGPPTPPPPPHFQQTPFSVPPPGPTPSAPSTTPPATPINALRNTALAIVGVTIAAIWMFGGGETTTRQRDPLVGSGSEAESAPSGSFGMTSTISVGDHTVAIGSYLSETLAPTEQWRAVYSVAGVEFRLEKMSNLLPANQSVSVIGGVPALHLCEIQNSVFISCQDLRAPPKLPSVYSDAAETVPALSEQLARSFFGFPIDPGTFAADPSQCRRGVHPSDNFRVAVMQLTSELFRFSELGECVPLTIATAKEIITLRGTCREGYTYSFEETWKVISADSFEVLYGPNNGMRYTRCK